MHACVLNIRQGTKALMKGYLNGRGTLIRLLYSPLTENTPIKDSDVGTAASNF